MTTWVAPKVPPPRVSRIVLVGTFSGLLELCPVSAELVLAAGQGAGAYRSAELGCAVNTAREWRRRFVQGGMPVLRDRPRSGRPGADGPEVRLAIVATATSAPPEGTSAWTHALIAAKLAGTGISASQAGRILADLELRPHRVRGWLNRADDPRFWAQAAAVCDAYLRPARPRSTGRSASPCAAPRHPLPHDRSCRSRRLACEGAGGQAPPGHPAGCE
jgi:Homeodomain-like domain